MTATILMMAAALALSPAEPPLPPTASVQLSSLGLYLKGTKIGSYTENDIDFVEFANTVVASTYGGTPFTVDDGSDPDTGDQVEYNGGFWPFSQGGLHDLTFGASVAQGLDRLTKRVVRERRGDPSAGIAPNEGTIVVYGYSQSAVIVGQYKAGGQDRDIAYVLESNPGRPNGGILSRFQGFTIPVLDIPMFGATPTSISGGWDTETVTTYDVVRQYDGWADFPKYPQNLLATANAVLGMLYLHGTYEFDVPAAALAPDAPGTDIRRYGD